MDKNNVDYLLLGRVLRLATPYRVIFATAAILGIVLAPLAAVRPFLIQQMVDDFIEKFDLSAMNQMVLILFSVLILEVVLRYYFIYSTNQLGQWVIRDLRINVFKHITNLKLQYFDTTPIGTSTTRTINDIQTINTVFTQGVITIIADILTLIVVFCIMLWTSWKLTLITLTVLPVLIIASYVFKEKVKASYEVVRNQISAMNAFLQERITGMRIVQIFNAEEKEMGKFKTINKEYTQANLNSILYYAIFFPVVEIISAVALGLMVWYGARGVISDEISLGVLVAFPIYLGMLFRPIRMLADKFNTLQMGLVAANRVFNVLDMDSHIENKGTFIPTKIKGKVEFDHVEFAYNGVDKVLKNINFSIEEGKTLAIIGSTGSGKTTIISILNRFYEIQKGSIRIDDRDIKDFDLWELRKKMSMVLQDVFLFSGSVFENITLLDESISREKVIESAKMIGAHEFIMQLPNGYDYEVMERGATLSMGQRQLISFVRALVFDPGILILDEATSSIDPETEGIIQFAIERLIAKRTSIIIAHRLSTIRHADNILVLDKGKVVEHGSHTELMANADGHYREFYEMQQLQLD